MEGVRNAVEVGKEMRRNGRRMAGIRLDSGDLAYLSREARQLLDEAGFEDAEIVGSNDLDEHIIESIQQQGGTIGVWGVGTRLSTSYEQPALDGVYKLSALRKPDGQWQYKVKLSEQAIKITNPGMLQVRRFRLGKEFIADAIYDERQGLDGDCILVDPLDRTRRKRVAADTAFTELLVPVFRQGRRLYDPPSLQDIQIRTRTQLAGFHDGIKRFLHPHEYPVGLEKSLHELKEDLIIRTRQAGRRNAHKDS
jgi:nicotinate phosphoribosyltransferase